MPKARSYKNQPWDSFEKQSYSLLKDDFVHQKLFTIKANVESTNGGVNLKESLAQKGQTLTSTGQTKLWFYFKNNQSLYTKILPKELNVQYDHGIQVKNNNSFNWYGGIQTNRSLTAPVWKVGLDIFSGKWMCNNLVQWTPSQSVQWHHKAARTHGNWFVNNFFSVDVCQKAFRKAAVLVAYKKSGQINTDYSARLQLKEFGSVDALTNSLKDSNVTLNWVSSKKGQYAHGVEFTSPLNKLSDSPSDLLKRVTTAFEINIPEQSSVFKLRLGGNWNAAVSMKHKLGNYGTYIWGAEISGLGSKNNVKFGVQIDLNL